MGDDPHGSALRRLLGEQLLHLLSISTSMPYKSTCFFGCCLRSVLFAVYSIAHRITCVAQAARDKPESLDVRKQLGSLKREAMRALRSQ